MSLNSSTTAAKRLNPYLSLGLLRNPFVLEDGMAIAPSLWIDRGYSVPPAPKAKQLIQIIGVKGAGKTSQLRCWRSQTGGPYSYYSPGWQRFKLPERGPIAYWDEADRMPLPYLLLALALAVRDRSTIVAGTHQDLSRAAAMVGLPVKTIRIQPFDERLLKEWVNRRIAAVRLPHTVCLLALDAATAKAMTAAADGSWREVADRLHVWAAQQANLSVSDRPKRSLGNSLTRRVSN